jgi:hypothetical protein
MATCRQQHKTMPDRVLKAQALPGMKQRAERVEDALAMSAARPL